MHNCTVRARRESAANLRRDSEKYERERMRCNSKSVVIVAIDNRKSPATLTASPFSRAGAKNADNFYELLNFSRRAVATGASAAVPMMTPPIRSVTNVEFYAAGALAEKNKKTKRKTFETTTRSFAKRSSPRVCENARLYTRAPLTN